MSGSLANIFKHHVNFAGYREIAEKARVPYLVIIIGVLISVFSYFALERFVTESVQSKNSQISQSAVHLYLQTLRDKEDALEMMVNSIDVGRWNTPSDIKKQLFDQASYFVSDNFEYVGLYLKDYGKMYHLYEVPKDTPSGLSAHYKLSFDHMAVLPRLLDKAALGNHATQLIVDPSLFQKTAAAGQSYEMDAFALVRKVSVSKDAYLVAISRFGQVLGSSYMTDGRFLKYMFIRMMETDEEVYRFNNRQNTSVKLSPVQRYEASLGGSKLEVTAQFAKERMVLLLELIPETVFLVLLGATGLFAAYIYAQKSRSVDVRRMNYELEDKNRALKLEVSKRAALNRNLKKSEQENRAVIDSISDIIFEADVYGNIIYVNASWARITGFSVSQTKDKNLFSLLHPQDQEREKNHFSQLVQGQKAAYRTFSRLRVSDGTFRAVEISISMMRRTVEDNIHVVGAMTDIEERRRAERALGEAEKKYRAIVENAAWGIYQMTPEGIYLSANPALVNLLGFENSNQMLHKIRNAHVQIYGNEHERKSFLREVDLQSSVNGHEVQIRNAQGLSIWVSENIRAVKDEHNNILYYEGSLEDITDRKEADLLLREAKMHSDMANRAKSEFLTNMSHELRTPLNAIIGFSEILKNESFGPLGNENYTEYVDDIHRSGKGLLGIINEILEISKIEVRDRILNEEIVDVTSLLNLCLSLMGTKIHSNNIEVTNMLDRPLLVLAEERAVKQIFMNILSNAIKFTPVGGRVTLRYEMSAVGELCVSITDTGVGLEPDQIKKALSPFGQVNTSLDNENAGTGLGLTLVKALVDLHDGKLEIFSQKGMGTTVTVKMPSKRVEEAQAYADSAGFSTTQSAPSEQA